MDLQFYGANCVTLTTKNTRVVIDDTLSELGAKSVIKAGDVALFTAAKHPKPAAEVKLDIDMPGEYEVGDVSITGIAARAHTDETGKNATMYKLVAAETTVLVTGHIYPDLTDRQLESIGLVDVMIVPVGGHGYTLDPIGALKIIKAVEPKLVIPVHYDDKALKFEIPQTDLATALHELAMEPRETTAKLKLKGSEPSDTTQLIVLEKS